MKTYYYELYRLTKNIVSGSMIHNKLIIVHKTIHLTKEIAYV